MKPIKPNCEALVLGDWSLPPGIAFAAWARSHVGKVVRVVGLTPGSAVLYNPDDGVGTLLRDLPTGGQRAWSCDVGLPNPTSYLECCLMRIDDPDAAEPEIRVSRIVFDDEVA
jgi:hypothetical protein